MQSRRKKTLADVAAAAGVSKMTASRALRGAADVSSSNVRRVRQAANDIGYVGNPLASAMSGKRSNLIGVVVPSIANIVFAEVLAGIAEGIAGTGLQPVFGVTDYDSKQEMTVVQNMLSWNPAGMVVTGLDQLEQVRGLLEQADIPVVQIMDTDGTPVDACVGFSQISAGRMMANALVTAGRTRFGYVGCQLAKDTRAMKRLTGFRSGLAQHGLSPIVESVSEGPSTITAGRNLTRQMLADHPDLDCIYYSNDDLAAGGAYHCIEAGLRLPDQLQLAGFNGLELVKSLPANIATTETPRREIGKSAAEIILGSDRKKGAGRHIVFSPKVAV